MTTVTQLRVRRGVLFTPVYQFRQPMTGRLVTLVGLRHVAPPVYYLQTRALIANLEQAGAVVFPESRSGASAMRELLNHPPADATEDELDVLRLTAEHNRLHRDETEPFPGWVKQYSPRGWGRIATSWEQRDLTVLDAIRMGGVQQWRDKIQSCGGVKHAPWTDETRHAAWITYGLTARYKAAGWIEPTPPSTIDRNVNILKAVDDTDRDVVLPWGIGHLPGLVAGLTDERGYEYVEESWQRLGPIAGWAETSRFLFRHRYDRMATVLGLIRP